MYAKELIKILEKNGWYKVSQSGSHLKMKNGNQIEIIPIHNKELGKGLVLKILKRTGIKGGC